jgi:2-dehydro-3-deoxy-D-arabinonate dehydratase
VAHRQGIRIRRDSLWNVPEPELTLVINAGMEIVGYCAGNDVSSRDIEGQNPLYLPQAKIYNGSCALGPGIELLANRDLNKIPIALRIHRKGNLIFESETSTAKMKRKPDELVAFLGAELDFPLGVYLMTGTGIVPPDQFSLQIDDLVSVAVGNLILSNPVIG